MQAFEVTWLRALLVAILLGLAGSVTAFLGVRLLAKPSRAPDQEEAHEYPAEIRVGAGRVPALLILLYLAMFVFIVAYATLTALGRLSY
jgi:hypothetical protein